MEITKLFILFTYNPKKNSSYLGSSLSQKMTVNLALIT